MTIIDSSIQHAHRIRQVLTEVQPHAVIPKKFLIDTPFVFGFTAANKKLSRIDDPHNMEEFNRYITNTLREQGRILGIGRYGEDRTIYRSSLYTNDGEARSVHLGVDLFVPDGTPIFAPLDATIHSFQNNDHFLDYGPTIILEHNVKSMIFYTLYGHLSKDSLEKLKVGQKIKAGEKIAMVGQQHENGSWPSHLHFQIITDFQGYKGDFPGVARPSEKEYYLQLCPDPNLLLHIKGI